MSGLLRGVTLLSISALLSGCAVFGTSDRARDNAVIVQLENKMDQLRAEYPGHTLEYGYGETLEQAQQQARNGLANQILVSVRTSTQSSDRLLAGQSESHFEASSHSFSNLRLTDTRVVQRGLLEEGERVYAVVAVDPETVQQIRDQAEKRVGVLALVEKLERDQSLSRVQRMLLAGRGLADAERLGLSDEPFVIRKQELSYRVYFDSVIDEQRQHLQLAFQKRGKRQLAVTLFDRVSLQPVQAGLPLRYRGQLRHTDAKGEVVFSQQGKGEPQVYLALGQDIPLDRLDTGKQSGRIYVSSQPAGAHVELLQDGKLKETLKTPNYFSVAYKDGKEYRLQINPGKDYEPFETGVTLEKGYDVFISKEFAEVNYGGLELSADSGFLAADNQFQVENGYGDLVFKGEALKREKIPTGRYTVTLSKPGEEDFQVVQDELFVREGTTLSRHYKEPRDREFYRSGLGFTLGFRMNRDLPEGHDIEVVSGTSPSSPGYDAPGENIYDNGSSLFLGLKAYGQYFTVGAEIEHLSGGETEYDDEVTHSGFGGSLSFGVYKQLEKGALLQLDLGYTQMEVDSSGDASFEYSADLSSPFVELSFAAGGLIAVRHYPDLGTTSVSIGLGDAKIKSGYRHPETVSARAEEHY